MKFIACVSFLVIVTALADDLEKIDVTGISLLAFKKPGVKAGDLLAKYDPKVNKINPDELSYDIYLPPKLGNGIIMSKYPTYKWPNATVPYTIEGTFSTKELQTIQQAIALYANNTCIRYVPRKDEVNYVAFTNQYSGCWSSLGMIKKKQLINLQSPSCVRPVGIPLHEMMHTIGFYHEQGRPDRDNYVTVWYDNIDDTYKPAFYKNKEEEVINFGIPYDFGSVMHYADWSFTKNGQKTITPNTPLPAGVIMGQRLGFSESDIKAINFMYCT